LNEDVAVEELISNIVFTKNRPLQLEAYLESLYRCFARQRIKTYIIYKVELFHQEYESVFRKFPECVIVREGDFHNDFIQILSQIATKYILFGIDDVVYFDCMDFDVIDRAFAEYKEDIFGFSFRFGRRIIEAGGDPIDEKKAAGDTVYAIDWTKGQTPITRYPFELCATVYPMTLVKTIIGAVVNNNPFIKSLFLPDSIFIKAMGKIVSTRSILKSFGYFYNPNTLESWNCRWCQNNSHQLPKYLFFQKLCASALQVNMVNETERKVFAGSVEYTIEALAQKYKQGYRLDIDYVSQNRPPGIHGGLEQFRLKRI
jgi:hypothetical protein